MKIKLTLAVLYYAMLVQTAPIPTMEDKVEHRAIDTNDTETRSNDKLSDIDEEDLDARSAYINNQYVADDTMDMDIAENPPLYEILQKQMEHVLAATGKDVPGYNNEMQRPPNRPVFGNLNFDNMEDDAEDDYDAYEAPAASDTIIDDALEQETSSYAQHRPRLSSTTPKPTSSSATTTALPTKRTTSMNKRPRPTKRRIITTTPSSSTTSTPTTKITTTTSTTSTTATPPTTAPKKSTTTTASSATTTATAMTTTTPITAAKPDQVHPNLKPNSPPYSKDTPVYHHKRRIIFKTISTGSQFVASPIGDLMIKFSIGFAKPHSTPAPPSANPVRGETVNAALRALSDSILNSINNPQIKYNKTQTQSQ